METLNEREVCVVSLKRSGMHAIITQIVRHAGDRFVFLNNNNPTINPYEHRDPDNDLRHEHKDLLIYNYESWKVSEVLSGLFMSRRPQWFGLSKNFYVLLVVRYCFNMMASQLKAVGWDHPDTRKKMGRWREHADRFLDQDTPVPVRTVSYNRWVRSEDYRRDLIEGLGYEFTDAGREEVTKQFEGATSEWGASNFDGTDYDGKASQMAVEERWKAFADNPEYREFFNKEDFYRVREICGEIPGTEQLV